MKGWETERNGVKDRGPMVKKKERRQKMIKAEVKVEKEIKS